MLVAGRRMGDDDGKGKSPKRDNASQPCERVTFM